jgi:GDPmannose 4,6-dehydratase
MAAKRVGRIKKKASRKRTTSRPSAPRATKRIVTRKTPKRQKVALITGITGQDGSYLAELLLGKGYVVAGIVRKTSSKQYPNIGHIQHRLNLIQADLLDPVSIREALQSVKPDEIYNLASQSHPAESFRQPIHTAEITAIGAHRVLDAAHDVVPKAKFYQASSSEMYGWVREIPQDEETPFNPANPYAVSKLYAHTMTKIYRKSYEMFAANGILFNHESPRRHFSFVTQKVTYAAACAKLGIRTSEHLNEEGEPIVKNGKVALGNLDARRDWGFAGDYVEAMWLILQQKTPDDYVIGTGETHSIRELCEEAFSYVGLNWKKYVAVDKRFIRPTETGPLVANPSKARKMLGWKPKVKFRQLVRMMVDANIARLK